MITRAPRETGLLAKFKAEKHPVKLTALLYLKEALQKEQYEVCPELILAAKEFGATQKEIRYLLEDPRRSLG